MSLKALKETQSTAPNQVTSPHPFLTYEGRTVAPGTCSLIPVYCTAKSRDVVSVATSWTGDGLEM